MSESQQSPEPDVGRGHGYVEELRTENASLKDELRAKDELIARLRTANEELGGKAFRDRHSTTSG